MNRKFILALLFFVTFVCASYAQQYEKSALQPLSTSINFGTIREDGGVVTSYVMATNMGDTPIYINKIDTSCGCTSASFPHEAILPHESVQIGISFDPMNRPGRFERDVAVWVSDSDDFVIIGVKGYVEPHERAIDEIYPFDMGGGLRLNTTSRAFGYLEHGWNTEESIEYINTSEFTLELDVENIASSGVLSVTMPECVAPNERGSIVFGYALPEDCDRYGTMMDEMYLVVNGQRSRYRLSTEVIAVDNFNAMDDISAPIADISKNIIKFGEVNCLNTMLSESIRLTNSGGSSLVVRSVEITSQAVMCNIVPSGEVAPNESAEVCIALDISKIENSDELFMARIRIITNDPIRPMQTIKVTAIPMW